MYCSIAVGCQLFSLASSSLTELGVTSRGLDEWYTANRKTYNHLLSLQSLNVFQYLMIDLQILTAIKFQISRVCASTWMLRIQMARQLKIKSFFNQLTTLIKNCGSVMMTSTKIQKKSIMHFLHCKKGYKFITLRFGSLHTLKLCFGQTSHLLFHPPSRIFHLCGIVNANRIFRNTLHTNSRF